MKGGFLMRRCLDEGKVTLATEAVLGLVAMELGCWSEQLRVNWLLVAMEIGNGCYDNNLPLL